MQQAVALDSYNAGLPNDIVDATKAAGLPDRFYKVARARGNIIKHIFTCGADTPPRHVPDRLASGADTPARTGTMRAGTGAPPRALFLRELGSPKNKNPLTSYSGTGETVRYNFRKKKSEMLLFAIRPRQYKNIYQRFSPPQGWDASAVLCGRRGRTP